MPHANEPSSTDGREQPIGRQIDRGTAQLAQFGATALVVIGVACFVLGHQAVLPWWLALLLGIPVAAAGLVLFWKAFGWEVSASQPNRATDESDDQDAP